MAAKLAGGSKRTADFAKKHGKLLLNISYAGSYERPGERLAAFVRENNIKTLNVAGIRASKEPKALWRGGTRKKSLASCRLFGS